MESAVEEAFEVQVLQPFHGWTLERFCDRSGNTFRKLTRAALQVLDRDDRLNGVPETVQLEVGVLRSPDWMWSHAWMPDGEYTQYEDIQKEGWLGVKGSLSRSWKLRYFLLRWDSSSLVCLRDRASMVQVCEELIDKHTTLMVEQSSKPRQFRFSVCNGERTLILNAVDGTSRVFTVNGAECTEERYSKAPD
ncbi:hypothetical protein BBO99_00003495 [Phytophthora kernoviae]|uniref:PH domain-containing protein n=2 Tax=Phytophthora kernoviae TaxID=325452 RepID=A0A3R7J0W9_9STRA|nr:hypothetical protein G195_006999 [Phytophthora kernoviae 00238/432]KAG2528006.1 hypothetical protein JM16_003124 [Phytophthora kernoviae]KAG2529468.1 hypothetical protein JM18_002787 [Phytophthora kernoviae]RLN02752.1 hypothetical protein BBI17_003523 [Phytophthora kernoviae]RLN81712.1 hypothetical protein BBO99_00003495 [Phytophthora kernoviae]